MHGGDGFPVTVASHRRPDPRSSGLVVPQYRPQTKFQPRPMHDTDTTYTHVTFVLDSSGSMSKIRADTIGGFNSFLSDQRDEPGEATVTLYEFNDQVQRHYQAYPIVEAPELDEDSYTPGGQTALHDAMVTAIDETDARIGAMNPSERPDTVAVVVLTDGKENASETTAEAVRERVERREEDDGWEFLFIGANQDAALTAGEMGIDADRSLDMSHSDEGAREAYQSTSRNISEIRMDGTAGGYTDADRQRQEEADDS